MAFDASIEATESSDTSFAANAAMNAVECVSDSPVKDFSAS